MTEHVCATPVIWWWTRTTRWTCACGRQWWMDNDVSGRWWRLDPSTIRDITPLPATPEAGR